MPRTPSSEPTWEEVLASFEASATEAEQLMTPDPEVVPAVAFDVWTLNLPEMPLDLRARAQAIRDRQDALAEQLRASMRALEQQLIISESISQPRGPMFVDQWA